MERTPQETAFKKPVELPAWLVREQRTQVKRNTTEAVCHSTRKMWGRSSQDMVVGFKHGMADKQTSSSEQTRILFCTEGIARNEILSLDRNRIGDTAIRNCKILLVDEAHSSNVDTELTIASILTSLNGTSGFKLVVMSATLDVSSFYRRAMEAGLHRNAVDHLIMEERLKAIGYFSSASRSSASLCASHWWVALAASASSSRCSVVGTSCSSSEALA